ncbi:hypothetical protein [Polaribacter cellanae]|uniref:Uncharacterized protein n=1 Tax=Polaribacter cellanae TaxID=2818493 RepID=A0A975CLC6_9FLAO|nr:hypothetical protein [Polaribacter cellanae]QTE21798.1 hypothetical protein J3359_13370 [Polaribacter cellanae]QTE21859.1 hypothetical protein J3359_13680 [Polaribacter cellanae]
MHTSEFHAEIPRVQNRNYSYTNTLANIVLTQTLKNSELKPIGFITKKEFQNAEHSLARKILRGNILKCGIIKRENFLKLKKNKIAKFPINREI